MRPLEKIYNPAYQLGDSIESLIARAVNAGGVGLPCKVVAREGWFVSVDLLIDSTKSLPTLTGIPIMGSRYIYQPFQIGDIGFLIPSSFWLDTVTDTATAPAFDDAAPNMANFGFLPLPRNSFSPNGDPESVIVQSVAGTFTAEVSDSGVKIGNGTAEVEVTANDVNIKTASYDVSANALFAYLVGMQTQYNANFSGLSLPQYTGTFE